MSHSPTVCICGCWLVESVQEVFKALARKGGTTGRKADAAT